MLRSDVCLLNTGRFCGLLFSFLDSHRGVYSTSASGPNGGPTEHRTLTHWKVEDTRPQTKMVDKICLSRGPRAWGRKGAGPDGGGVERRGAWGEGRGERERGMRVGRKVWGGGDAGAD